MKVELNLEFHKDIIIDLMEKKILDPEEALIEFICYQRKDLIDRLFSLYDYIDVNYKKKIECDEEGYFCTFDTNYQTPLLTATYFACFDTDEGLSKEILLFLLSLDECDVNLTNEIGETALSLAIIYGSVDIVELLLATGKCNVNVKNLDNFSLIQLNLLSYESKEKEKHEIIKVLLETGGIHKKEWKECLKHYQEAENHEMVQLLEDHGII